jgi:hypothetical protein
MLQIKTGCQKMIQPGQFWFMYTFGRNHYFIMDNQYVPVVMMADLIVAGDQSG